MITPYKLNWNSERIIIFIVCFIISYIQLHLNGFLAIISLILTVVLIMDLTDKSNQFVLEILDKHMMDCSKTHRRVSDLKHTVYNLDSRIRKLEDK